MSKVSGLTLMICSSALISSCATMQEKTKVTRADDNRTMLQSVEAGQTDMVETILKSGADPDAVNEDGEPALIIALEAGNADMVEALLNAGADPDPKYEDD